MFEETNKIYENEIREFARSYKLIELVSMESKCKKIRKEIDRFKYLTSVKENSLMECYQCAIENLNLECLKSMS
jgi:hypothetical protein